MDSITEETWSGNSMNSMTIWYSLLECQSESPAEQAEAMSLHEEGDEYQ